jgi:hypothetical protein
MRRPPIVLGAWFCVPMIGLLCSREPRAIGKLGLMFYLRCVQDVRSPATLRLDQDQRKGDFWHVDPDSHVLEPSATVASLFRSAMEILAASWLQESRDAGIFASMRRQEVDPQRLLTPPL